MELLHQPLAPWHLVGTLLAALAILALLSRGLRDRWAGLLRRPGPRAGLLCGSILGLGLLAWALWQPSWIRRGGDNHAHLEVLLDVSDSMRRDPVAWQESRRETTTWIRRFLAAHPKPLRKRWTASITTFGASAAPARRPAPIPQLPTTLEGLDPGNFAPGRDTDLAAGLTAAARRIRERGGQGAILLVSDGYPTTGDTEAALDALAPSGIAVHPLPARGSAAALAVAAANLPDLIPSGAASRLRGSVANQRPQAATARLTVQANPGLPSAPGPHGTARSTTINLALDPGQSARFRPELEFSGFGIQVVDLVLETSEANRPPQFRRFYTQVQRPPRLLILGDNRWMAALAEEDFEVIQKQPADLHPDMNLADVDAVILSGMDGARLPLPVQDTLRRAVEELGLGLFFINGPHPGDERTPSILASWHELPVAHILPVVPRKSNFQPPERHVILMLDTSGSMGGWEVPMKRIARNIVERLRPADKLDIIAFTVSANQLVQDLPMTEANKTRALAAIDGLAITGGTSPRKALDLIANRKFKEGGLIFISDGGFSPQDINASIRRRPDLRVTVFSCGNNSYNTLQKLADPIFVNRNFDPAKVEIPYFGGKEIGRYYEKESFTALPMPDLRRDENLPLPNLPIPGSAFSTLHDDATLVGVRPRLTHPVLATRRIGNGRTAAWTSALQHDWIHADPGREAVAAWIRHLIGFSERDRYAFHLDDLGHRLDLTVSLHPEQGRIPRLERLQVRLLVPGQAPTAVSLDPDAFVRGVFRGKLPVPDTRDHTRRALLELTETGEDALAASQRIPLVLPAALPITPPAGREDWTHGVNTPFLQLLATHTGGTLHPDPATPILQTREAITHQRPLWPWFALAGGLSLLGAVACRRLAA